MAEVTALSGAGAFTVVPRCSPPDLVRLWCARMTGTGLGTAHRETGGVAEDRAGPRSFPAAGAVGGGSRVVGGQLHLLHP